MTAPRAADLPVGSIVICADWSTWMMVAQSGETWRTAVGEPAGCTDEEIDISLAADPPAEVSRTGWPFE